jgi:hypothetical protein
MGTVEGRWRRRIRSTTDGGSCAGRGDDTALGVVLLATPADGLEDAMFVQLGTTRPA